MRLTGWLALVVICADTFSVIAHAGGALGSSVGAAVS
jgi:hypothetical protein